MPDSELSKYGLCEIAKHAHSLNAIDTPDPLASISYDVLAGAVIWSDETNATIPVEVVWELRILRHYRTHLMLNDLEPSHSVWEECVALFPDWVGFLPERRQATMQLRDVYRRGDVSTCWCLRQIDREE